MRDILARLNLRDTIEILLVLFVVLGLSLTNFVPRLTLPQAIVIIATAIISLLSASFLLYMGMERSGAKEIRASVAKLEALASANESIVVSRDVYLRNVVVHDSIWIAGAGFEIHSLYDNILTQLKDGIKYRFLCVDEPDLWYNIAEFLKTISEKSKDWDLNQIEIRRLKDHHFLLVTALYDPMTGNAKAVFYFPYKTSFHDDKFKVALAIEDSEVVKWEFRKKFSRLWDEAEEKEKRNGRGNIDLSGFMQG